jgi:hypothetical protein
MVSFRADEEQMAREQAKEFGVSYQAELASFLKQAKSTDRA